ncbi:MAG: DUF2779 domain-containing protein [Acidobacteria bacterium]|nr:DUF2779 domain-containing protein [Acidobacteriota bacterium]
MKERLTKTAFLRYLKCPPEFWLSVRQPLLAAKPTTLEYEHLRQQGYAVQQLVKTLKRFQPREGLSFNFERPFQTFDLYARCDIVVMHNDSGMIDLYETKSAASVKDEHIDDVAFQRLVCEQSGYQVGRCFTVTTNTDYVRRGEIDAEQLFTVTDVTDLVEQRLPSTAQQARAAIAYLRTVPVPSLLDYCDRNRLNCEFIQLHFPNLPDYTVFDIAFLKNDKRRLLLAEGIVGIVDVPDDFPLSTKQRAQVEAAKTRAIVIDGNAITERIERWEYPLQFLDYETFAYAIPQFDGVRPYQQMCFQYSLHTIDFPGTKPRHSYFLSRGESDPPRAMAESLRQAMEGNIGTVLVWYEAFEKTRNTEMAAMYPDLAAFFGEVNSKTVDLMKIFSEKLYVHPEFKGRSSIKKVLPALRPDLSYKQLRIGDGLTATISWFRAVKWDSLTESERESIFKGLEKYCELDTWAMVAIFEELAAISSREFQAHTADSELFFLERA